MTRLLIIVCAVVFVASCGGDQPTNESRERAATTMGLLFEKDGISVYRFYDEGRYHYVAVPRSGSWASASTEWTECRSCGRNCRHCEDKSDAVSTVGR
jgi:hypothetical protein